MFCQNCGAKLADNDRFCGCCGTMRHGAGTPTAKSRIAKKWCVAISWAIAACSVILFLIMLIEPAFSLVSERDMGWNPYFNVKSVDRENHSIFAFRDDHTVVNITAVIIIIAGFATTIFSCLKKARWRFFISLGVLLSVISCMIFSKLIWESAQREWESSRFVSWDSITVWLVLSIVIVILSILGWWGEKPHKQRAVQ